MQSTFMYIMLDLSADFLHLFLYLRVYFISLEGDGCRMCLCILQLLLWDQISNFDSAYPSDHLCQFL